MENIIDYVILDDLFKNIFLKYPYYLIVTIDMEM